MLSIPLILAGISLAIWIVLTFFWGAFWHLQPFDDDAVPPKPLDHWPQVTALLPARNEAETIARTVDSLIAQDYRGEFRIVIVDDHSEDQTAALARRIADVRGVADHLAILPAAPLQPGWTGKL